MSVLLPKCVPRKFMGRISMEVLVFIIFYGEKGVQKIRSFIRQWRRGGLCGVMMLRITLAWAQFNAGTGWPILNDVHTPLPHFKSKWLNSIRAFSRQIDGNLLLDKTIIPQRKREHDHYTMDLVLQSGLFSDVEIRMINYCPLYLQAVTLLDIAMPDGTWLDMCKLKGSPSRQSSQSASLSVRQAQPSERAWAVWYRANQLWSSAEGRLLQPLGVWLHAAHALRTRHFP